MKHSFRGIDWPKFGRDLVVIILGVLVALAFDNWAATRTERRLERQYLLRLSRDLRADSVMLASYRRTATTGELAGRQLLALLANAASNAADSVVARLFSDATRGAFLNANTPTIDELKSTGRLSVLRDARLRDGVLSYYSDIGRREGSLETVMRRGRDPLAELGWDIQAFDFNLAYAANLVDSSSSQPAELRRPANLLTQFKNHAQANRATHRAVTYNGMLQPILLDWERALADLRVLLQQSST